MESLSGRIDKLEKTVAMLVKQKKQDDGPKKSRPPTAYQKFMKAELPHAKEEFPDKKHSELFSIVAKRWKEKECDA